MATNADFADAAAFRKAGDNEKAIISYKAALTTAKDSVQKGRILLDLAYATSLSGDDLGATPLGEVGDALDELGHGLVSLERAP